MGQEVFYQNIDKYPAIVNDYQQVKALAQIPQKDKKQDSLIFCALESLPPVRRVASLPDKLENGDVLPALGLASLALINLPEDLRDIKTAKEQVSALFKGQKYQGAYNYKDFQHEFSFFRGTLLERFVNLKKVKNVELAKKLLKMDKSLLRTNFGEKVLDSLNVERKGYELVKKFNKETCLWEIARDINGDSRIATAFKGSAFGKLTARAMSRTTLIGTAVLAAIELPKIIKALDKGDNMGENVENASKQTAKSTLNVALTTAGIGYGGAIGSKYLKGFGSIVGMGIGAIVASKASQKLQDTI